MKLLYLFLCLFVCCEGTKSLNILTIFPFQGKSHSIVLNKLIEELLQRGHNVTDVSFFKINKDLKNYHHINLAGTIKILEDDFLLQRNYITILQIINFVISSGNDNCRILLENKEVQDLLKRKENFDLVVVEQFNTDCPLALAYKLGAPVVTMSTTIIMPWFYHKVGAPYNPSFAPVIFLDGDTNPSLYQRIERSIFYAICRVWYKFGQMTDEQMLKEYFDDVPPLEELAKKVKISLTYSSLMLFGTNVLPTNVIEVGGFHVGKPERLPNIGLISQGAVSKAETSYMNRLIA